MVFHQQFKEVMVVTAIILDKLVGEAVDQMVPVVMAHLLVVLVKVKVVLVVMDLLQYSPVLDFILYFHHLILMV